MTAEHEEYPSFEERVASRERVEKRPKYTDPMLGEDRLYADGFMRGLDAHDHELTADEIATLLNTIIVPHVPVDTVADEGLSVNERTVLHVSRLVAARGPRNQARYSEQRKIDRILSSMEVQSLRMKEKPPDRAQAIARLIELRASLDQQTPQSDAWFVRTLRRLMSEPPGPGE